MSQDMSCVPVTQTESCDCITDSETGLPFMVDPIQFIYRHILAQLKGSVFSICELMIAPEIHFINIDSCHASPCAINLHLNSQLLESKAGSVKLAHEDLTVNNYSQT